MKAGIIGCGTIGSFLAQRIKEGICSIKLVGLFDKEREKAIALSKRVQAKVYEEGERLVEDVDLLIEAASVEAAIKYGKLALEKGKDVLFMSTAALLLDEQIMALSKRGGKVWIPSGAIAGVDAIKAARCGKIKSVLLTSYKSPSSLRGYLKKKIEEETIVFEGSAKEAVLLFPAIINVAATITLAAGMQAKVRIVADPKMKENIHRVEVEGDFGKIEVECKNLPSLQNPKTSMLALLSAQSMLEEIGESVKIGT
jgi:aspartate dehydrogenase